MNELEDALWALTNDPSRFQELSRGGLAITCDPQALSADYFRILGTPSRSEPTQEAPSPRVHRFLFSRWPHLFWSVYETPEGKAWNVGFENQYLGFIPNFDPEVVAPNLWTRVALARQARHHILVDGWDHELIERFDWDGASWYGRFCFGLLVDWSRKLSDL